MQEHAALEIMKLKLKAMEERLDEARGRLPPQAPDHPLERDWLVIASRREDLRGRLASPDRDEAIARDLDAFNDAVESWLKEQRSRA